MEFVLTLDRTKQIFWKGRNDQLTLIKVNENKCLINGELPVQMMVQRRIIGDDFPASSFILHP